MSFSKKIHLQDNVKETFEKAFGRTPTRQRLEDILREAIELSRATDYDNMKEEVGDLLSSAIMLCCENHWEIEDVVSATLEKIKRRQDQYKALGRKINVVLIGGAYDPVTEGHVKLAQFILNASKTFDEAWLVPCFKHLYGKNMTHQMHRIEMCRLAIKHDARIKLCTYEIENELSGETYHFAKKLLSEDFAKDKYDFSIAIGMDNANTFHKWVNYEDLERMMRFVVVSRQGVEADPKVDWYRKSPHIYLHAETDIPLTSSTEVRKRIKNKESLNGLVNPDVEKYIIENELYV